MTTPLALGLDVGSGSVRALLLDRRGRSHGKAAVPLLTKVHRNGDIDLDAEQLVRAVARAVRQLFSQGRAQASAVQGIGLACQRSTSVVFDPVTTRPLLPAISWQCQRTAAQVEALPARRRRILQRDTGLPVLPQYAAPKLKWLRAQVPGPDLQFVTLDAFLAARLTQQREPVTDLSMASRTLLVNLGQREFSVRNRRWFGLEHARLPRIVPSMAAVGTLRSRALPPLPAGLPLLARAGDQQAALFAAGLRPGDAKITYGSGAFLLAPAGNAPPGPADPRLLRSVAWSRDEEVEYLLESNVPSAGTSIEWLARLLGRPFGTLLREGMHPAAVRGAASFLPALGGLGPHRPGVARGVIADLDLATGAGDLAVALGQGIAGLLAEGRDQVEAQLGRRIRRMTVDGGGSRDPRFLQLQSDLLRCTLRVAVEPDATAHGAAAMAWGCLGEVLPPLRCRPVPVRPRMPAPAARALRRRLQELMAIAGGPCTPWTAPP